MNKSKGFTLIELVMVITLLGIIAGVIALPLMEGTRGWFEATTREGITESGRIAIERMMREIRNTARKADNTPNCISVANAQSISFSDFSGNLTTCNSITFTLSAPNITRTDASGTSSNLVNDVTSLDIKYYSRTNVEMTRPVIFPNITSITRVSIEIESTKGGETTRKYSEVYLPNAKRY